MLTFKLGDCLSMVQNGAVIKQYPNAGGIPITRIETLSNDRFNRNRLGYADITDPEQYSSYLLDDKDILMSHINSRTFLGRSVLYRKEGDELIIHGMNLLRIKTKESVLLPEYANYYFKTAQFKKAIDGIRKDAINQSSFSTSDLKNIEITIPPIEEQYSIVKILLLIDDKISLNERIIDNLESTIRSLYNYWFVQFDFPSGSNKPYRDTGGIMVWNEDLKRCIPEGWDLVSVNDLADTCRGVSYDSSQVSDIKTTDHDILVLRGNNIKNSHVFLDSNTAFISSQLVSPEQHLFRHDIIMTMSSGSKEHIGKCAMFQYDVEHTLGAFLSKLSPKQGKAYYLFSFLMSDWYKAKIKSICNGTGINNLTNDDLNHILLPNPPDSILDAFNKAVSSLFDEIGNSEMQNLSLLEKRDRLLPLLMNGQVTVKQ